MKKEIGPIPVIEKPMDP